MNCYIKPPKVNVSRQNMLVWKEFANNVILQEMDRRKVSRDFLIEELVTITKSQGEYRFKIMSNYCNPQNTVYFTVTRFNLILPTLLKWNKQNKPSFIKGLRIKAMKLFRFVNSSLRSLSLSSLRSLSSLSSPSSIFKD